LKIGTVQPLTKLLETETWQHPLQSQSDLRIKNWQKSVYKSSLIYIFSGDSEESNQNNNSQTNKLIPVVVNGKNIKIELDTNDNQNFLNFQIYGENFI